MGNVNLVILPPHDESARLILEFADTPVAKGIEVLLQNPDLVTPKVCWDHTGIRVVLGDSIPVPAGMEVPDSPVTFERGDVVVYPDLGEIVLVYSERREDDAELVCYKIGRVAEASLDTLDRVANIFGSERREETRAVVG
jgi:hypothetical protein